MNLDIKHQIEKIFRQSNSANALFDAFENAISNKINDPEVYKTLLSNKTLNIDEVKFYAEVLSRKFSEISYDLYLWTGSILETCTSCDPQSAFDYYKKALFCKVNDHIPLLKILSMYNPDLDLPPKEEVIKFCSEQAKSVKLKSRVYFALAEFCGKLNDEVQKKKFSALAAKCAKEESG